jgi:amino acid permease
MDSRPSLEEVELNEINVFPAVIVHAPKPKSNLTRVLHSFAPQKRPVNHGSQPAEGDTSPLKRVLKGRHLQFIAIGGSIGAGLFIGCGKALAIGGPGSLLIAFSIVGIMLFCVMHALGELAAIYPISGKSTAAI